MLPDEASTKRTPGYSYLLAFLEEFFSGDDYSRSATRKALAELAVFYVFIAIGFLLLWCTWRSNANVKKWKQDFATALQQQKGRKFEPSDAAKLYGLF